MNKRWLVLFLLMIALPAFGAEQAGLIKVSKGAVFIERGTQKIPATLGTPVFAGDVITTGIDGSVGLTLRDNTMLSAGPKSRLTLDNFAFNTTTYAGKIDASLKRGSLAVVSGKLAKQSPDAVQFRTETAIFGVRGTQFVMDVYSKEE